MPSNWVLNYRAKQGMMDGDDSDSDTELAAPSSEDSRLFNEVDISSRDETVVYKPNPFSIAKINAGVRKNQPPHPPPSKNRIPPKKPTSSMLPQSQSSTTTAHIRTSGAHTNYSQHKPTLASSGPGVQSQLPSRYGSARPAQLSSHPTATASSYTRKTLEPVPDRLSAGSQPTPAQRISPRRATPPQGRIYPIVHPSPRPDWVDAPSSSPEPGQHPAIFQLSSQGRPAFAHSPYSEPRRTHTSDTSLLLRNVVSRQANPPSFFAPRPSPNNARPDAVFFASAPNLRHPARLASLASPSSNSPRMLFSPARPTLSPAELRSSPLNASAQPSRVAPSLQATLQTQARSIQRIYESDRPAWIDESSSPDPTAPPTPPRKRPIASVYNNEDEEWGTLPSKKSRTTPLGLAPKFKGQHSAPHVQGRLAASQGRPAASQGQSKAPRSGDKRATFTLPLPGMRQQSRMVTYMPPPPDPRKQPALAAVSVYYPPSPPKSDPTSASSDPMDEPVIDAPLYGQGDDVVDLKDHDPSSTPLADGESMKVQCPLPEASVTIDVEETARAYSALRHPHKSLKMDDILPGLDSCGAVWEEGMPDEMGIPIWRGQPTTGGLDPLLVTDAS